MDSGALLDLLGNENRRRILRLLAQKSCYVTEISDYLEVSPKAVIDHLRRLEEAGLIESRTDENRRKYFYIANDVRLEVNVSRYGFGAKSAYPASSTLDLTGCEHLTVNVERDDTEKIESNIVELAKDLNRLEQLENELSLAQRFVHRRVIDIIEEISESIETSEEMVSGRLAFEVLVAIANGQQTITDIQQDVEVPLPIIRDTLSELHARGIIHHDDGTWTLPD